MSQTNVDNPTDPENVGRYVMVRDGKVVQVDRLGLAFIESQATSFTFTFDKLEGYRGEEPRKFGLHEGVLVHFTVVNGEVESVKIADK